MIACLLSIQAAAQARVFSTDTLRVEIPFQRGSATLDMGYCGTSEILDGFASSLDCLNRDSSIIIHSINITSAASPEGLKASNDRLSRDRAQSILEFLSERTTLSPSQMKVSSRGENWEGLFRELASCDREWKDEALSIILECGVTVSNTDSASAECKRQLQSLCGGEAWEWMDSNIFPALRNAGGFVYVISSHIGASRKDTLVIYHEDVRINRDTLFIEKAEVSPARQKTFRRDSLFRTPVMAFRSNLLVPLMNVGVEVPLSERFSLGADWYWPWAMRSWMNTGLPSQKYCVQGLAGSLEARWWLGKSHSTVNGDSRYRLCGHSIGIIATGGYYDMEYDWSGEQGEFIALGADYMYSLPLGKGGVHFDFDLGIGWCVNRYRKYDVRVEGGHLIGDGPRAIRELPVPIRARFSLVIPVFRKEVRHEK